METMHLVVGMVIALVLLVLILIIATGKLKFLSETDQCEKQGGSCKPKLEGCGSNEIRVPYPCPKETPSDPDKVCCRAT